MNTIQFFANKNCTAIGHRSSGFDRFEVQMWPVDIGNSQEAWCGSLRNVHSREKQYFKGWSGLVANLQEILTPFAQLEVLKALLPAEEVAY